MKINKMTLALMLTMGVLASTNAGFSQETTTKESSGELMAACPLFATAAKKLQTIAINVRRLHSALCHQNRLVQLVPV